MEDLKNSILSYASKNGNTVDPNSAYKFYQLSSASSKTTFSDFLSVAKQLSNEFGFSLVRSQSVSRSTTMEFDSAIDGRNPLFTYEDVGGFEEQKEELRDIISMPLLHGDLFKSVGISPVRGILLHGPPGCGKTLLAEATAGEFVQMGMTYFRFTGAELVNAITGQTEAKIRSVFKKAASASPCLVFIDDLDSLSGTRVVAQLCSCLDDASTDQENHVVVIAATSKIDGLPATLRRPGRLAREISVGIPDYTQRVKILQTISRKLTLSGEIDFSELARECEGFVAADLMALSQEAALRAVERSLNNPMITEDDFYQSLKVVQPSLRRDGFSMLPSASFNDVGGLGPVMEELKMAVVDAIIHPEIFELYGHRPASGVLMYGPPGCGKTLLARAVAHESDRAAFISVKGPELLNKYLGESESAVRTVFKRAKDSAPCIIFFDEIDAICPRRSDDSSNAATSRVVNQLLTEMDGASDRGRVFVIGATNRPDMIDEAMLRPGRLDKKILVPLPNKEARKDILSKHARNIKNLDPIDLDYIAEKTEGYSGADLEALTSEAIEFAIRESYETNNGDVWLNVTQEHFLQAVDKINSHKHS